MLNPEFVCKQGTCECESCETMIAQGEDLLCDACFYDPQIISPEKEGK
jgi:hypothetical protein